MPLDSRHIITAAIYECPVPVREGTLAFPWNAFDGAQNRCPYRSGTQLDDPLLIAAHTIANKLTNSFPNDENEPTSFTQKGCVFCFNLGQTDSLKFARISAPTTSSASTLSLSAEWTPASLNTSTSGKASSDDTTLVSVAAPPPSTDTGSTLSAESELAAASTDDADAVDEAISDFDAGPLDDALLEDLAVALVG